MDANPQLLSFIPYPSSPFLHLSSLFPPQDAAMLLFKKKFLDAIRSGRKTQTIRLWKYPKMRAGQRSYIPGAGYIRVTAVDEVSLDSLTDDDARRDGFDNAAGLRAEIAALYPRQLAEGQRVFRIVFACSHPSSRRKNPSRDARRRGGMGEAASG